MVDSIYSTGKSIEVSLIDGLGSITTGASSSSPKLNIAEKDIDDYSYVDGSGVVHELDFAHIVIHELIHLSGPIGIPGPKDNDPADFSTPGTD